MLLGCMYRYECVCRSVCPSAVLANKRVHYNLQRQSILFLRNWRTRCIVTVLTVSRHFFRLPNTVSSP